MYHVHCRIPPNPATQRAIVIGAATATSVVILAVAATLSGSAFAQMPMMPTSHVEPIIYPAKGQTPAELARDKYECHDWAKRQSGFDPTQSTGYAAMPAQPAPSPTSSSTSSLATAGAMAGGGASGAAIAELSHHDVGRGAAIGVLGGGLLAQAKQQATQHQAAQMKQQQAAQAQSTRYQQRSIYDRALSACMDARGYTVR